MEEGCPTYLQATGLMSSLGTILSRADRNLNECPVWRRHQLTGWGRRGKKSRRRKPFRAAVKRATLLRHSLPSRGLSSFGNSESKEDAFHPCPAHLNTAMTVLLAHQLHTHTHTPCVTVEDKYTPIKKSPTTVFTCIYCFFPASADGLVIELTAQARKQILTHLKNLQTGSTP